MRKIVGALVLLLAGATQLAAQQTFYVPVLQGSSNKDMGFALSNRSLTDAIVTLTARDYTGVVISGTGIINPAGVTVPALGQRALSASQIFGPGIAGSTGWIEIQSLSGVLSGVFTLFDSQLSFVDGADLQSSGASRLVFPKVSASSDLTFIHTGPAVSGTASFYRDNGQLATQNTINLAQNSGFSGAAALLLPSIPSTPGYVVIDAGVNPSLFGFATLRNQTDIALLAAFPATALLGTGYFPQIATQAEYATTLTLVNTSPAAQTVTLTAFGLDQNTTPRTPSTAVVQRTVPAMGRIEETMSELFGLFGTDLITGALKWETQPGGPGLIGAIEIATTNGALAAVRGQGAGASDLFFPQIAEGSGYYTGIALMNPDNVASLVSVEAFDGNGVSLDRAAFTLAPGEKRARLLSQVLPGVGLRLSGHLRVSASRPVVAFEAIGATSLGFLAAVLTPDGPLPAQSTGSVIVATSGAVVTSQNGGSQLVIPPGALAADTVVTIGAPATPVPAPPNQEIVAVVDANPGGTGFRIPVRLTMALSAQMQPDTLLPLLVFDSTLGQLVASGFDAVLDDSGRNAMAFVTHFSTFALAVDSSTLPRVPVLAGVTPSTATYGTGPINLRLTGVNFDPTSVVRIDGTAVTTVFADSTLLFASLTATQIAPGIHGVTVYTPPAGGGESAPVNLTVGFPLPVASNLSPAGGLITRFTDIVIVGSSFFPQSQVLLDGQPVATTFVSPTRIDARITSNIPGAHAIAITNPIPGGGQSNALSFTFAATVTLTIASGDNQAGFHGAPLDQPLVVRVNDSFGSAVAGTQVLFEVVSGGGSVSPSTPVLTNAQGLASAAATLGDALGSHTFRASSADFSAPPVTFSATSRTVGLQAYLSGLTSPVFFGSAHDGSGRRFIVEQPGIIRVIQPGALQSTVFLDISSRVVYGGEQGLLGLAFHPQYSTNRRFFVNYTRAGDGATVIAEYKASADPLVADPAETVLLTIAQPYSNHNGGMIAFGPDGFLYIAMGDGGAGNDPGDRAQNIDDLLGKMLRIDIDNPQSSSVLYSSPATNPFFGSTPGRDEIFATGLRNPWRFSFDRLTGQLYLGDVGQSEREEIDIVTNGGNYGWRVLEGTLCTGLDPTSCSDPGFIPPIAEYSHAGGRCSVTGGYVYRGSLSTLPAGAYLYADFCQGQVFMHLGGSSRLILAAGVPVSSFGEDDTGELYVVGLGGTIHRLVSQ